MKTSNTVIVGILTVITLGLSYWGFNFLKGKDIFNKENTYYVVYDRLQGLEASNPIYIRGYKIGQVDDVYFTDHTHSSFTVVLNVNSDIYVTDSTVARIFSNDLMGNKAIEIILGNNDSLRLKDGDTLIPQIEESLSEQVKLQMLPLKKEAEKLIIDLQNTAQQISYVLNENTGTKLAESFSKISKAIESIYGASNSLDSILTGGRSNISKILNNFQSISKNLKSNNEQITGILTNFEDITDSISKSNITQTLLEMDSAMSNLNTLLARVEQGEGSIGLLFNDDSLYSNLANATESLDILLKDIEENPKRYVHFSIIDVTKDKRKKKKKKDSE